MDRSVLYAGRATCDAACMPANRIPLLLSMVYGIAVGLSALLWDGAVAVVAVVGAMILGLAWVFLRSEPGAGRQRNRNRNRA